MAETYCGKTCGSCVHKEKLQCPGCKTGPGARIFGTCELGKCCVSKGHDTCQSCNRRQVCRTYMGKENAPTYRLKAQQAMEQRQTDISNKIRGMDKVYFILFLLLIINCIGSVLTLDFIGGAVPVLMTVGELVILLTGMGYGVVLLTLSKRNNLYLFAGLLFIIAEVMDFISNRLTQGQELSPYLVVGLIAGLLSLIGMYKEFSAHGELFAGADMLADEWDRLWKWTWISYAVSAGSILVILISPLLGAIMLLLGSIGVLAVLVIKVVYLYHSAQACKEYA